jgi:hypothetical protein
MHTARTFPAVIAAVVLGVSCGGDDTSSVDSTTTTTAVTTTPETTSTVTTTTTEGVVLAQPAIWPAADVVFATPEEAAADFVRTVLGVEPLLGEYMGGDSRSGEIEVFSPGETTPISRGLLDLRILAPNDGWFVIGAANPNATISSPEVYAEVPAGALTVEGVARGHEGTVVLTAFLAGDADAVFDQVITSGGVLETPEPYSVTIDLTGAAASDIVTLLVHGDTGLENDPGEFGAIAVVIAD